jgi:predicted ATPase/DNA-binding CsgD family transcriptional regulator
MSDATHPSRDVSAGDRDQISNFPDDRASEAPLQNNLPPQLTSFVGREREVAHLEGIFADGTRLLTLTGPGGSGKTRLALALATQIVEEFEDGVWWVELAPISEGALVEKAVAQALMVREEPDRSLTETLARDLAPTELLLMLDNCEHLIGACAELAERLLRACPNLSILATSREALGISGERSWLVPSLSLPDTERLPAFEKLADYEAISLFVERAQAVDSTFELTEGNASAVAQLCSGLDGMPLAIELAAARVRVLSVEQIAGRLEDPLGLLRGGRTADTRHGTLRATLEWSHGLLDEPEQALLRRLSVFAEGWELEAAEAVCSGEGLEEGNVLDLLSGLVDKSMAATGPGAGGALRYRMLEPVRQYGGEKLEETGEAERVRERHARYYLAEATESAPMEQGASLERLGSEHANFRAALSWSLDPEGVDETTEDRAELGLRLAAALAQARFWAAISLSEGLGWLERALRASSSPSLAVRIQALDEAGYIAVWHGQYEKSVELLEESFAISKQMGDRLRIVTSLFGLGNGYLQLEGSRGRVDALCEEAAALRREPLDPPQAVAPLLLFLGLAELDRGNPERMMELLEEALPLFRELGDLRGVGMCLTVMGHVALDEGNVERAASMFEDAAHVLQELKDIVGSVYTILGLAGVVGLRGDGARAARLWGAAEALREAAGFTMSPWTASNLAYERHLSHARSQLDEAAWEAAWSEGRKMTAQEAVAYALEPRQEEQFSPKPSYPAGLSPREAEVLKLVARGLTNAQIADDLFISPRTVERHLNSVYHKSGASSRVAAARFATEHGLS